MSRWQRRLAHIRGGGGGREIRIERRGGERGKIRAGSKYVVLIIETKKPRVRGKSKRKCDRVKMSGEEEGDR